MADELNSIKSSEELLRQVYREAGGKELDRGHNSCLACSSHDAWSFWVKDGKCGFKCHSCGAGGSIVDLVMLTQKCESKVAVKWLVEKYGRQGTGDRGQGTGDNGNGRQQAPAPAEKQGKLYADPLTAFESALWGIQKRAPGAVLVKRWIYTKANGDAFGQVARFDLPRVDEGGQAYVDKEFRPATFHGNGWRLTAKHPSGEKWPLYRVRELAKVAQGF